MATNYKYPGETIDWTNAGSAVAAGDVVPLRDNVGVALVDVAANAQGAVALEGCFTVPKATGAAWQVGDALDFDNDAAEFDVGASLDSGDIARCAVAVEAADASDTTGVAKLTPGTGTRQA